MLDDPRLLDHLLLDDHEPKFVELFPGLFLGHAEGLGHDPKLARQFGLTPEILARSLGFLR
jgi:hypothetical protein